MNTQEELENLYDHIVSSHCTNDECHATSHFYEAWKDGTRYLVHKRFGLNELDDFLTSRERQSFALGQRDGAEKTGTAYENPVCANRCIRGLDEDCICCKERFRSGRSFLSDITKDNK